MRKEDDYVSNKSVRAVENILGTYLRKFLYRFNDRLYVCHEVRRSGYVV